MRKITLTLQVDGRNLTFSSAVPHCPDGHPQTSLRELLDICHTDAAGYLDRYVEEIVQPCTHTTQEQPCR